MINLISPEQKRDIRAARSNVMLANYCVMLVLTGLLIGLIYGIGYWVVLADKGAVSAKRDSQSEQIKTFAAVKKEADVFRSNLRVAKNILDKEISYSTFLTTLASDLPQGAVLRSLSIGAKTKSTNKPLLLDARVTSYEKALELKKSLEDSILFEDVSLVNANRPDDISGLAGLEARYPYEASYSVKLTPGAASSSEASR